MKRLIVTADDFGADLAVNEAVEQAHTKGILTSASLMVSGGAAEDAVRRALANPSLKVGLHLVLVDGTPILPEARVTHLINGDGRFRSKLVEAGIRYYFSGRARAQLEAEIRAQFEAFADTGLALDHVDAHHHMHLHPTIAEMVVRIGAEFGVPAVRVPDEPAVDALCLDVGARRSRERKRRLLRPFTTRLRSQATARGLLTNDVVFGLYDSGHMDTEKLVRAIANLPDGVAEIYLHPSTVTRAVADIPHPSSAPSPEQEYRALIHPRVARAVEKFGVRLTSFSEL